MLHPSTKRLIDKLGDMTHRQKVAWQEAEDGHITHETEGYRVTLTPAPHAVLLTDSQGREIETCTPAEFADDVDQSGRPYTMFVEELYREAKRHARGAEEAINAVLAGLVAAETVPTGEDAPEDGPEVESGDAPDAILSADEDIPEDATIEDPLDDSSPLETDAYQEMDSQSDITFAVASLADQVNGESAQMSDTVADNVEEDTAPSEDEVLTDENTAIPAMEALQETGPETEMPGETSPEEVSELEQPADPEEAAGFEPAEAPVTGFGVSSTEAPAPLEPADDATPLNAPEGGYTPTGYVDPPVEDAAPPHEDMQTEPSPSQSAEPDLPPMFIAEDTETPAPEPEPEPEPGPEESFGTASDPWSAAPVAEADQPETPEIEADDAHLTEPAAMDFDSTEPAAETDREEPATPAEPEPAPQGNFTSSFFGGGFGSGLGAYRSDPAPERVDDSAVAAEADPVPPMQEMETVETVADPVAETAQPEPVEPTEPPRAFSLSGIGARPEPDPAPAPLDASAPVEPEADGQLVIDGTNDLPVWPGTDPAPVIEEPPETSMVFDAPATEDVVEVAPDPAPEPDFAPDVSDPGIAADAEPETGDAAAEETPARPVKRFNPWN